ncbi:MAG TPA: adenylyl-sulfate kinase [Solirubrobacteraceae bacterium]|nr:adenylyl-sulfate kinase [Solirubrobacteraceae bacterium]
MPPTATDPPPLTLPVLTRADRARRLGQVPAVVWFTGLSGAGKSTVAELVEAHLHARGCLCVRLDGDVLRDGLCADLGFSAADRDENIRRITEVARLMYDAGLVVLVSVISPFRAARAHARGGFPTGDFLEVFVDAPLEVVEARDPKGLYARARRGELRDFTGVDSPYEAPDAPEVHLLTGEVSPDAAAAQVLAALELRAREPGAAR